MVDVVLVHGAGGNHTSFRYQTRWLDRRGHRARAIDLPGHGSNREPPLLTVEELADWVASRIDEPAAFVGHSLGGMIALQLAATKPDLVTGLVMIGSALQMPVSAELAAAADAREPAAVALMIGWSFDQKGRLGGHPDPGIAPSQVISRTIEAELESLSSDLQAAAGYDGSRAARSVSAPTLVVGGLRDRMVSPTAVESLSRAIDGAFLRFLDSGHMIMTEAPDALRIELGNFLRAP